MQQKTNKLNACIPILMISCLASNAYAINPIPKEDGISGFINLGVGGIQVESNMLAEAPFGDLGSDRISNLTDSADEESNPMPIVNFELAYTWADSRTQVFIGNQLEDFLRFDFDTRLGVRQEIGAIGTLGLSFTNTSINTETWEDPYDTTGKRSKTDRSSKGARIELDRILGSNFEVRFSSREVEIDDELSGNSLGSLTAAEIAMLDREGDTKQVDIAYAFDLGDKGILVPRLSAIDYDRDGDAMTNDGVLMELSYAVKQGRLRYVTNVSYGSFDFDDINPIYGVKDEVDRAAVSFNVFWADAFGLKGWSGNAGFAFYQEDHDIDFYDAEVKLVNFTLLHQF